MKKNINSTIMRETVVCLTLCVLIATLIVFLQTLTICAARVPVLPVLTPRNRARWPKWHAYYEEVYGVPVQTVVDLNTFTFFYRFSPLCVSPIRNTLFFFGPTCHRNVAFTTSIPEIVLTPETKISKKGYFVSRREYPPIDKRLEVIRARMPLQGRSINGGESMCAWYYHAVGSGLFIDIQTPLILNKRRDCLESIGDRWPGDDDGKIHAFMSRHNLKSMIFEYKGNLSIERHREVIVPLKMPSDSACPLPFRRLDTECGCADDEVMACRK